MKCFPCPHISSHSPTPSHMLMPSVVIVTGNANDTHLSSLCRITNTQCNLTMGNKSRVNPDSYHSTLGLSDNYDRVFYFGQQNFSAYTVGLLHPYRNFGSCRGSLTPIFQAFHLRRLRPPSCFTPHTLIIFHFMI